MNFRLLRIGFIMFLLFYLFHFSLSEDWHVHAETNVDLPNEQQINGEGEEGKSETIIEEDPVNQEGEHSSANTNVKVQEASLSQETSQEANVNQEGEHSSANTNVKVQQASPSQVTSQTSPSFTPDMIYFKVVQDRVPIYVNENGERLIVGTLLKNQEYIRVKDEGNWHKIKYSTGYAYVWKGATVPSNGNSIKNKNNLAISNSTFVTLKDTVVYDNSSGQLVPFANIAKGVKYPIIKEAGNWYAVDVSGRIGYVHKSNVIREFTANDRYFKVTADHIIVYDNSSGQLVPVGVLLKGQEYIRVKEVGNWHQIKYGKGYGYVWKAATEPSNGSSIKNINQLPITKKNFTTLEEVVVYDNSSGQLVPFAKISKDVTYPIIREYGNWYAIDVSGRIGYVHRNLVKRNFSEEDHYFKVLQDNVVIYDNSSGKLVPVGKLLKGQEYVRVKDAGNWHQMKFGNGYGYVWKAATEPSTGVTIHKPSTKSNSKAQFKTTTEAVIYDNSSGQLVPFAKIHQNVTYPIVQNFGNWYEINISGRVGYIHKSAVTPIISDVVNPRQVYSYYQMELDIRSLEAMYPELIKSSVIGKSVDGRNIYAVRLGFGRNEVLINASHHAREHITTNLVMEMVDEYAEAYYYKKLIDGYNVRDVLAKTTFWFVPMVNPDGVTLVQQGHKSAKNPDYVLKLNNNNPDFSAWKANIRGVDLNRQYPAHWDTIRNNPGKPGPKNFKGYKPLSEPEAIAMYQFAKNHVFKASLSYHSSGELIYWYFHQTGDRYYRDLNIAKKLSQKTGYRLVDPTPNPSGGGFNDWFLLNIQNPGFTPEVAPYVFEQPVPLKYFDRIWLQNYSVPFILASMITW
jgi:SH3-like domain-containing protein